MTHPQWECWLNHVEIVSKDRSIWPGFIVFILFLHVVNSEKQMYFHLFCTLCYSLAYAQVQMSQWAKAQQFLSIDSDWRTFLNLMWENIIVFSKLLLFEIPQIFVVLLVLLVTNKDKEKQGNWSMMMYLCISILPC